MKILFLIFLFFEMSFSQSYEVVEKKGTITFVSSSVIYLTFGRADSISVDDTVEVIKENKILATLKIVAVAKNSSASEIINSSKEISVGDSVRFFRNIIVEEKIVTQISDSTSFKDIQKVEIAKNKKIIETKMKTSGRVSLQYVSSWTQGANVTYNQPAFLTRLNVENILETDFRFSLYGRTFYNLHKTTSAKSTTRFYDVMIESMDPNSQFYYSIGRLTSRYVGGLGITDGLQTIYNLKDLRFGLLVGAEPHHTTFGVDGDDKKGAMFVNYNSTIGEENKIDGTIAFASHYYEGKIDREFIYLQNSLVNSSNFTLYHSTEFDLNEMNYGVTKKTFKLTNTYISSTYIPKPWLTIYGGFDASRSIYLLETMRSIPDTLFDKNLLFGYRLSTTFRMPNNLSLTLNGSMRTKKGETKNNSMYSGMFRASDILQSGVSFNTRVSKNSGIYTEGNNLTFEMDRYFFESVSTSIRYDYYNFKILSTNKNYTTHTTTGSFNWRVSQLIYAVASMDYVTELNMRSIRFFGEIGVRF